MEYHSVDQPAAEGVRHSLRAIARMQLGERVSEMDAHSLAREEERSCYLLGGETVRKEGEHLALAGRDGIEPGGCLRTREERSQHRIDIRRPGRDELDRPDDLLERRILLDEATGARIDRLDKTVLVSVTRIEDDGGLDVPPPADRPRDVDSRGVREAKVEQDDGGVQLLHLRKRLAIVARLADDRDAVLGEEAAEQLAYRGMVVDDEAGDRVCACQCVAFREAPVSASPTARASSAGGNGFSSNAAPPSRPRSSTARSL